MRQPTWVSPVQGLEQHYYSREELETFRNKPETLLEYRKENERNLDTMTHIFNRYGQAQKDIRELMTGQMKEKINSEMLDKLLIPKWSVGCRRLTPGVNYLETLTKDNVDVHFGEISQINEEGAICDNGKEYKLDILICATGFDTSFRPRFPTVGLDGADLRDVWKNEAKGYLSLAAPKMPNYFMFLGPASPIGNGPVISAIGKPRPPAKKGEFTLTDQQRRKLTIYSCFAIAGRRRISARSRPRMKQSRTSTP